MVLKYHISPYPALTESMWVRIWEAQSDGPSGWVYEEELPERNGSGVITPGAGHQVPVTVTVNGLDKVVHVVRLFTNTGILLHEYNAEPKVDIVTVFDPIRFKIGDGGTYTPAENTSTFTHPSLVGLNSDNYIVLRNGYGALIPNTHITVDAPSGSWSLSQIGDVFGPDEEFTVILNPKSVSTVVNDSVVGKMFAGFVDISASRDYLTTDLRKLLRFSGTCTYTFGASQTIPIGYIFAFTHFGTATGIGTVQFLNAPLKWGNTTVTTFAVERFQEAAFIFDGVQWNVLYATKVVNTPKPGDILGSDNFSIGDIPAADAGPYTVTHGLNITGDYNVFLSIKTKAGSEANWFKNNSITHTWWHSTTNKPNEFKIGLESYVNQIQSIDVSWLIVQL